MIHKEVKEAALTFSQTGRVHGTGIVSFIHKDNEGGMVKNCDPGTSLLIIMLSEVGELMRDKKEEGAMRLAGESVAQIVELLEDRYDFSYNDARETEKVGEVPQAAPGIEEAKESDKPGDQSDQ